MNFTLPNGPSPGGSIESLNLRLHKVRKFFSKPTTLHRLRNGVMALGDMEVDALLKWVEYAIRVLQWSFLAKGRFEDTLQLDRKTFIQQIPPMDQDPPFKLEP